MISAKTSLSRAALRGGAATFAIALLSVSGAALAQTSQTTTAAAEEINDEGTIVVTGTLISNPNLVSSSPIITRSADVIQLQASNTAESVIRDIPGVVPSIGSQVNNGNGGASFVNLRGIGENRNLVLLNGNRIVPANLDGVVDLNNIPLAMIERVDVSTGAAVTTYGADAIAGVINFVTKRDFTGVDLQLSSGITEVGDGATFRADLTIGGNFADGRGNAVLSIGYQTADPVFQSNRAFSRDPIATDDGTANPFNPSNGSNTTVPTRFSGTRGLTAAGVPNTTPEYSQVGTTPDGVPILSRTASGANGGARQLLPETGAAVGTYSRFNFNPYNIFQTPFERFNIFAQANYEVSDAVEVYSRGLFSKQSVETIIAPSGAFGLTVDIPLANPYLPSTLRNQFCALNVAPTVAGVYAPGTIIGGEDVSGQPFRGQTQYIPQFTPTECAKGAAGEAAVKNVNQNGTIVQETQDTPTVRSAIGRRAVENGTRNSVFTTTVFDYTAGLRGPITDSISWDLSGGYGESNNSQNITGYWLNSRTQEALLATNPDTCLSGNPTCVPLNIFGPAGSITPAMNGFLGGSAGTVTETSLLQVNALISGDTGFTIPWATEQAAFAVGYDYRDYGASITPDFISGTTELGGGGGAQPPVQGSYNVNEFFGELIIPVVQDKPFFENVTIEGGLRYSSYKVQNDQNTSYDALTWKVGGNWEIGGGFKIRGNYSLAVRAPNIGELFTPETIGLTSISYDPCQTTEENPGPATNPLLAAVCVAQGAPSGLIGSIEPPSAGQGNAVQGGNPLLVPETATTWTVGAVYQPTFAPGLSMTFDYYNILVEDAITQPASGDALGACFANLSAASVTDPACLVIRRNPESGSFDGDTTRGLYLQTTNSGRIFTDGVDFTLSYSHNLGWANLGIIGQFNYTFTNTFQALPNSVNRDCLGYYSPNCGSIQPQYNSNLRVTLGFDWVDASVLWRHLAPTSVEPLYMVPVEDFGSGGVVYEPFQNVGAYDYVDLTGRFHVVDNLDVIFTITNLFNAQPPVLGGQIGTTAYNSGNTFPSTYDPLGRRYTMQVVFKF